MKSDAELDLDWNIAQHLTAGDTPEIIAAELAVSVEHVKSIRFRQHQEATMRLAQKIAAENGGVEDLEPRPPGVVLLLRFEGFGVKIALVPYPDE